MKRILAVCLTCASISVYGQQTRMQADVFAAFAISAEQSHAPVTISVSDLSGANTGVTFATQCETTSSGNTGSSAGVVVQEELVAGRFGDTQLNDTKKRFARLRAIMQKPDREKAAKERE